MFDNVAFGLKMRNIERQQIAERVNRALGLVQLTGLDQRYPRELSGGQQQRVALARALVIEPAVLLLDEPLSNLDANLREQMRFEIREIQKRIGITTVFVTHDQNEAMAVADRMVVMSKGEIRQVGTAQEIYERPRDLFVATFIGQANLLRGTITAVRDAEVELGLDIGQRAIARHDGNARVGDPKILALRPEDLQLGAEEQPGMNNIRGTVMRASYLGAATNVGVRIGDATLVVSIPRGRGVVEKANRSWSTGGLRRVSCSPKASDMAMLEGRNDLAAMRPYYRLLGLRVEAGEPAGLSKLVLESRSELENSRGEVHGGVIASLLDVAMGVAVRSTLPQSDGATTVSLTVNYVAPGRSTLTARGRVVRKGRTLASVEATVMDASEQIVAHAVGTMRVLAQRSSR